MNRDTTTAANLWLVGEMVSEMPVQVGANQQALSMKWAEGMLGVMPVFKTEGQARAYARMNDQLQGGCRDVWAVELVKDARKKVKKT
jgi:hypothetical protein